MPLLSPCPGWLSALRVGSTPGVASWQPTGGSPQAAAHGRQPILTPLATCWPLLSPYPSISQLWATGCWQSAGSLLSTRSVCSCRIRARAQAGSLLAPQLRLKTYWLHSSPHLERPPGVTPLALCWPCAGSLLAPRCLPAHAVGCDVTGNVLALSRYFAVSPLSPRSGWRTGTPFATCWLALVSQLFPRCASLAGDRWLGRRWKPAGNLLAPCWLPAQVCSQAASWDATGYLLALS